MFTNLDFTSADPTAIHSALLKPCCNGNLTHDCQTHFLTDNLTAQVYQNLSSDKTGTAAKVVAEIAKYDKCREFLAEENIISNLVANLSTLDAELLTQSCRALANLCYELSSVREMIIKSGGLDAVICVLKSERENSSESTNQMRAAAIGLLLNLITENSDAHAKVHSSGLPHNLTEFARAELNAGQVTNLSQHVILILVTLADTIPMDLIFTLPVCQIALDLLAFYKEPMLSVAALEFLEEASVPDIVKLRLVQSGLFEFLMKRLEEQPNDASEEENAMFELMGRVLANMLGGDEAMEYVYNQGQRNLLSRLGVWLKIDDYNRKYCSALCIGNIARTDAHSREIVEQRLHIDIASCLKCETCDIKMQHAILSTLRNLAIPKENKKQLAADGVLDILHPFASLDIRTAAPVIFKLIGTWRQLVDGQQSVALKLGKDKSLLQQLVKWADDALCPWVSSEALRLLCSLMTVSRDRVVAENLVESKAIGEMSKLVTCEHTVMQMEAVNALTVGSALLVNVACPLDTSLLDASIGEKIKLLLLFPTLIPELLENLLTMLEILLKFDKLRRHFIEVELLSALEVVVTSKESFTAATPKLQNIKNLF